MKRLIPIGFEFSKYVLVGGICTTVDWSTFYFLCEYLGLTYLIGFPTGFILGAITHYTLNRRFTFSDNSPKTRRQLSIYITIIMVAFSLNFLMMALFIQEGFSKIFSRIITTGIMLFVNFFLHKLLTFNQRLYHRKS
jgi:putative flippase GtrA